MPSKKTAIKELKKSKKKQQRNLLLKKALKKEEKKIASLLADQQIPQLKTELNGFISRLDKAVGQKLIHKNKASRQKSRILKKLHQLGTVRSKKTA